MTVGDARHVQTPALNNQLLGNASATVNDSCNLRNVSTVKRVGMQAISVACQPQGSTVGRCGSIWQSKAAARYRGLFIYMRAQQGRIDRSNHRVGNSVVAAVILRG